MLYQWINNNWELKQTKYFVGGIFEKIADETTGATTELNYINGGDGLAAIFASNNSSSALYYIHKDHLGSFQTISNSSGTLEEELSFCPWGRRRSATDWEDYSEPSVMFDRGYTGHEHLDQFNLINMNGRVYDPILGRFLSPDNYVQLPDYSQSLNRYSYCLNNPLIYTDPSGESFVVIGLIVLGSMIVDYGVQVAINYANDNVGNPWIDNIDWADIAVSGAVGGLTAGYGSIMSNGTKLALTYGAPLVSAGIDLEYNREAGGMELDHKFKEGELDNFLYEYISSAIVSKGVSAAGVKANTGIKTNDALTDILKKSFKEMLISFGGAFLYDRAAGQIFESTQGYPPAPIENPEPDIPTDPNIDPFGPELPTPNMYNSAKNGIDASLFNLYRVTQ
ncbi:MAG: RHS repeat domain-containing protein [bacterium]